MGKPFLKEIINRCYKCREPAKCVVFGVENKLTGDKYIKALSCNCEKCGFKKEINTKEVEKLFTEYGQGKML